MRHIVRTISILTVIILFLSACNLPSSAPASEAPNAVYTAAALTVMAQTTRPVGFSTPTLPLTFPTNTAGVQPTAQPSATQRPPASATAVCDQAQFVRDINIPDGSQINPGAAFTKTWRVRNVGVCTWSGYSLVFDRGDLMGGTPQSFGTVSPGQEADLSVNFTAPTTSGTYRSYWRIRNSTGVLLAGSFFVDIKVLVASSGYDLYTRAPDANWNSGAGNFAFGGPDNDVRGFAMYRTGLKLEDGGTPNKVLETHPQWVENGVITGFYPSYTVIPGEHFTAKVGFLAKADGTCGVGDVKFQLNYKESGSGTTKSLGEWADTCDTVMREVDVNLSSIAGKTVQFALAVLANGPAEQDWAVWVNPQVKIP